MTNSGMASSRACQVATPAWPRTRPGPSRATGFGPCWQGRPAGRSGPMRCSSVEDSAGTKTNALGQPGPPTLAFRFVVGFSCRVAPAAGTLTTPAWSDRGAGAGAGPGRSYERDDDDDDEESNARGDRPGRRRHLQCPASAAPGCAHGNSALVARLARARHRRARLDRHRAGGRPVDLHPVALVVLAQWARQDATATLGAAARWGSTSGLRSRIRLTSTCTRTRTISLDHSPVITLPLALRAATGAPL